MATNTVKPNGDNLCNWAGPIDPGNHHTYVDEYPGSPDSLFVSATNLDSDNNDVEIFNMTTFDDIEADSITQIVVYTYGRRTGVNTPEIDVSFDNGVSWESGTGNEPECAIGTSWGEVTNTWAGLSYSKADLDNLLIKYIADVPDKDDLNQIDRIYAVITYTEAVVGYGHDFLGIPAANIDSIMGIPTANIDNICGL